jgi:isocitrate/isopropylmalate dehydrogenase
MFESGAGTAPMLAGRNKANPIGRILAGALMLRHIGAEKGAQAIEKSVLRALQAGWRTPDLATSSDNSAMILGTAEMGNRILGGVTA